MPCAAYLVEGGEARCVPVDEAGDYAGDGFVWTHVDQLEDADLATLREQADIPEVAANALVATETRPRCDRMDDGALINLRGLGEVRPGDSDRLVSIRFWVRHGKVNSVSRRRLSASETVVAQVESGTIRDSGDLVAAFARGISGQLDPEVAQLGDTLDDSESGLTPRRVYGLRSKIARVRSEAIAFRRFVAPNRDALLTLAALDFTWLAEDDRLHIREAADRFARMTEELEAVRERAALLHEQLTDLRGELMESRSLLISIVALVFLPLTFITGLFGMNVGGIPIDTNPYAFWRITGSCVFLSLAVAVYFFRIQWLRTAAIEPPGSGGDQASSSMSQ